MNRSSRMNEKLYDNGTLTEHYQAYPYENTRSTENIDEGDRVALCENAYKILPTFAEYINASSESYLQKWQGPDYVSAIKISLFTVIIVVGLVGNTSVILNVALNKSLRTTVNIYISNLAFADVMTCIVATPGFYQFFSHDYVFGEIPCKLCAFALSACVVSSVFTLSAITFDRFMAVIFPLHVRFTKPHKPFVVAIIWIVSMMVTAPFLIVNKIQTVEFKDFLARRCVPDWSNQRYYHESLGYCTVKSTPFYAVLFIQVVFLYFLPIMFMIIAYSIILWRLSKTKAPGEQLEKDLNSRKNRRVNKMVFVVLLVLFISWTPYHVAILYESSLTFDYERPEWWSSSFWWASCFFYVGNSCMNPIIYAGFKQDFRQGINAILCCGKPDIRPKPHQALDSPKKPKSQEVHLEMETKSPCAGSHNLPSPKETSFPIEEGKETEAFS